jgi:hypothetical protein
MPEISSKALQRNQRSLRLRRAQTTAANVDGRGPRESGDGDPRGGRPAWHQARCGGCLAAAQSVRHGVPPCLCPRSRSAETMAAGAVLGVMASDLQAHLFASLLNGHTADVSLVVRGAAWEGVYRLHRVVLIQAVRSLSLRGWNFLIIGDPGHTGFLPVALSELRVLRDSSTIPRPGRD